MKTLFRFFAVAGLGLSAAPLAEAGPIVDWNFNLGGVSGTQSNANTALLFTSTLGTGTMSSTFVPSTILDYNGTLTNAQGSDTAGVALALQGGATATENNGSYLQFGTSTVGESAITVSFAIQATGTGFNSDQLQYTTDGVSYVNFGATFAPVLTSNGGFTTAPAGLESFNLASIAGLNNDPNAGFRIVFNGATSSSGNNRIDNLVIGGTPATGAVPEPASVAMLGIGLAGGLLVARRRARWVS